MSHVGGLQVSYHLVGFRDFLGMFFYKLANSVRAKEWKKFCVYVSCDPDKMFSHRLLVL